MFPQKKNFIFNSKNHCSLAPKIENTNDPYFCNLQINVSVSTDQKSKQQFYDIEYRWSYNDWDDKIVENPGLLYHPFCSDSDFMENSNNGEVICKNEFTDMLVKYLLMDFEEMSPVIGNTLPCDYKRSIMKSITEFWD